VVITDLGMLAPEVDSQELQLVARYDDVSVDQARAATGWPLRVASQVDVVAPPTADELGALRDLHARTLAAHSRRVTPPG
jgi:glutaconate CoA-transferase subunit B